MPGSIYTFSFLFLENPVAVSKIFKGKKDLGSIFELGNNEDFDHLVHMGFGIYSRYPCGILGTHFNYLLQIIYCTAALLCNSVYCVFFVCIFLQLFLSSTTNYYLGGHPMILCLIK